LGLINKIHFYNPLPGGDAVLDWLSAGDIYVQPSHTEGLPRSLIEAMSVGLPCVGTNVGGIPELLDSICLVPPKDVHALSEALKIIISNYELRKEQSRINLVKSASYHIDVLNSVRDQFLRENVF
jgi:glycosyltransferase involved in cell wall biosynthesis